MERRELLRTDDLIHGGERLVVGKRLVVVAVVGRDCSTKMKS